MKYIFFLNTHSIKIKKKKNNNLLKTKWSITNISFSFYKNKIFQ